MKSELLSFLGEKEGAIELLDKGNDLCSKIDYACFGKNGGAEVDKILTYYSSRRPELSRYITAQFIKENWELLLDYAAEYQRITQAFWDVCHEEEDNSIEVVNGD